MRRNETMKIDEKYINTSFVGDAKAGKFLKDVFMCSGENEIVDFILPLQLSYHLIIFCKFISLSFTIT